jgi:hypothetical protein
VSGRDPRLRRRRHRERAGEVAHAANGLQKDRLLLDEDVERYVDAAAEGRIIGK